MPETPTASPRPSYDVLITGGSGFIGTAVVRYLLEAGKSVVCLDHVIDLERLGDLGPRVVTVEADVRDADAIERWVAQASRVVHLAAVVGVDEYIQRPVDVLEVNILGTRNVLLACTRHRRPLVFASTSESYGKNCSDLGEDFDRVYGSPAHSRWSYAISKTVGEQYAYALAGEGLVFCACRYFNVYGALLDRPGSGRVVSKFLGRIRDGLPLLLVDDGKAVRSLCYIDDAAEATARLALELSAAAPFRNSSINVGRVEPVTVRELAEIMIDLSGHRAGCKNVPGEVYFGAGFEEIPRRVPRVDRLAEAIGFYARTDLRTGLARTLDHWGLLRNGHEPAGPPAAADPVPEVRPRFEPDAKLMSELHGILESGQATNGGPRSRELERRVAEYLDVPAAVAVSTGYDGLALVLRALGHRRGRVVLPSYTFIATLNAVLAAGLEPVFCDIDPETFTLSPEALENLLPDQTDIVVVVAVNVFGVPPELAAIRALADRAGAALIYDNAQGFGTEVDGVRAPAEPLAQVFSLHATKLLPAAEGGLVASADPALLLELRVLRNHGIREDPLTSTAGVNAKLDELRAAVALHSLEGLPGALERRRSYAGWLRDRLVEPELGGFFRPQRIPSGVRSNFQNLGVRCALNGSLTLDEVIGRFRDRGVGCRSYFNPALHHLESYRGRFRLPRTDEVWRSLVSLPIHSRMDRTTLARIAAAAAAAVPDPAGAAAVPPPALPRASERPEAKP